MLKHQILADRLKKRYGKASSGEQTRLPPLAEVAKQEGFSLSTVQHAIRNLKDEGFVVTKHAQGTFFQHGTDGGKKAEAVAYPLQIIGFNFFVDMIKGSVFRAMLWTIEKHLAEEGRGRPWQYHNCMMNRQLLPVPPPSATEHLFGSLCLSPFNDEYLRQLIERFRPMVSVDRDATSLGLDSVVYDTRMGALITATRLLDMGHQSIGYLGTELTDAGESGADPAVRERFEGFQTAHAAKELSPNPDLCVPFAALHGGEELKAAFDELLSKRDAYSAIIAYDEGIGGQFMKHAEEKGIKIPDEFTLAAAGGASQESPIGGAYYDATELMSRAWGLLCEAVEKEGEEDKAPVLAAIPPKFEERETVRERS